MSALDEVVLRLTQQGYSATEIEDFPEEIARLTNRVEFLERHCDLVTESLLQAIDKAVLPKFEEARSALMKLRETNVTKRW